MIRAMVEQEGRTVFISSHLLDEVEKICDAAAIVDRGKVVAQGPLSELTNEDGRSELIFGVDDVELAAIVLERCERARSVSRSEDGLRVVLDGPPEAAAEITAALVHGGVGVARVEPVRESLERRFLEITSRLDATPEPPASPEEVGR